MKKVFVRFNDLRRKEFAIKTSIFKDNDKKIVVKEAIYEEGKKHIRNVSENENILKQSFENCRPCPVKLENDKLVFDFIKGELLADKYIEAFNQGDKNKFLELIEYHKSLILGKEDNSCVFESSKEFENIFGDASKYNGVEGIKISNFEATSYNIIIENNDFNNPVFIDYEWVFKFAIPKDFILYQCLTSIYFSVPELNDFIKKEELIRYLNIKIEPSVLREFFDNFCNYQMRGNRNKSMAERKYELLKKSIDINELTSNINLFTDKNQIQKSLDWHIDRVKQLERAIEYHHNLDKQLQEAIDYEKMQAEQKNDEIEQKNNEIEQKNDEIEQKDKNIFELRKKIFEMENSRSWRWTRFFRKNK